MRSSPWEELDGLFCRIHLMLPGVMAVMSKGVLSSNCGDGITSRMVGGCSECL